MIVGDLLLVMGGSAYFSPMIARSTLLASFGVQVANRTGTSQLQVDIEHRNRNDTSWSTAGTVSSAITSNGFYSNQIGGLKELVRYKYFFTAGADEDGMYVITAAPQWLND